MNVSNETKTVFEKRKDKTLKRITIVSDIPYDRPNCICESLIYRYKAMKAQNPRLAGVSCPRDKTGMKHYNIVCSNCGEIVAQVWSADKELSDFCDLHYVVSHDDKNWFGAATLNISQIDGKLGIECSCGQDTRDFRANNVLSHAKIEEVEKIASKGRAFGKLDSKFKLKEIK